MASPAPRRKKSPPRHFDTLEQEAFLNLWRSYDRLHEAEEELFGRYDLTPQQYNALRLLRGCEGEKLPTLALAARLVSRAADITRMLDKLEQRSLVDRERRSENRRIVLVGITPAGRNLLKELDPQVRACGERQLGHLADAELRQLITLLQAARRPHEEAESHWRE